MASIRKHLLAASTLALMLASGAALAQLGNGGGKYEGVDKVNLKPAQMVEKFVDMAQGVLGADNSLLSSVGLAEQAGKAGAEAKALTPDASRGQLESALKLQTDSGLALEQKLAAKADLNDAGKQQFSAGIGELSRGVIQYAGFSRDLNDIKKNLRPIGGANSAVIYLAKVLPTSVKELGQTLKAAVAYAKANNIAVPAEADEALAQL